MSLHEEIEKATMIPKSKESAKFVRLKGPSQATKDRMLNERQLKPPKNIELIDCHEPSTSEVLNAELRFNEHEIASSIKAVNGGMTYSNESLEYYLRLRQQQGVQKTDDSDTTLSSNDSTLSSISSKVVEVLKVDENVHDAKPSEVMNETVDQKMEILRKFGLSRNAAISGLFKQNKISFDDLLPLSTQEASASSSETDDCSNNINLVPHPEEPDVFVQPWQAYGKLDPDKCKDIDFTVDRIGKKKTVTARQHFIFEDDDSSFAFVKKTYK